MMLDGEDDIAGDIAAAFKEAETGVPASAAPAAVVEAAPAAAEAAPGGQPRDPAGKFAPKEAAPVEAPAPAEGAQPNTDQPAAAATEAQGEPIRPPSAWSAPAKAKFATLDPEVQAEIAKRERDMDKGMAERAAQLRQYEPLEQVIAPLRNHLAINGTDPATYFRSLAAADQMLRGPNPSQALAEIARMYGIPYGQAQASGQQPQQAQLPPQMQAMAAELARLSQTVTQQQSEAQAHTAAQSQATIDAFAKDSLYFDNVKPEMIALLKAGIVDNLPDAYRKACWARDDIRPLLLKEDETKRQGAAAEAARAKATQARQASGSVTGAPAPGASAAPAVNANSSIEDDVRAAFASLA